MMRPILHRVSILCLLQGSAVVCGIAKAQAPLYGGAQYSAGSQPRAIVLADVSGDGIPDAVIANFTSNGAVTVAFGDGNGGFPISYSIATAPYSIGVVAGDLNGDGMLDLVSVNYMTSGAVSVLIGSGTGLFSPYVQYPAGPNAYSIDEGDVDGDGRPDLVVANYVSPSGTLSILSGNGSGGFAAPVAINLPWSPVAATISEFNNDGVPDLAAARFLNVTANTNIAVLLGSGSGAFAAPVVYFAPAYKSLFIVTADLDNDGNRDVAISHYYNSGSISVFLGLGNGLLAPAQNYATDSFALGVAPGDLNGDGNCDVVVAEDGPGLLVMKGGPNGVLLKEKLYAVGGTAGSAVLGDLNNDGLQDVVTNSLAAGRITVLMGMGNAQFAAAMSIPLSSGPRPDCLGVADLNVDGMSDFATANYASTGSLRLVLSAAGGSYTSQMLYTAGNTPDSLAIADFNGDGFEDILAENLYSDSFSLFLNSGPGAFPTVALSPTGIQVKSIAVGDLDADGVSDLAIAGNSGAAILLGDGLGGFGSFFMVDPNLNPNQDIVISDLNGDNNSDLITAINKNSGAVEVYLGTGPSQFQAPTTYPALNATFDVATGDLNGDGRLDVAASNWNDTSITVFLGTGSGKLSSGNNYYIGTGGQGIAIGDLNSDGNQDIACENYTLGNVSVLLGSGDGVTFTSASYGVSHSPVDLELVDFDQDGSLDVTTVSQLTPNYVISILTKPPVLQIPAGLNNYGTGTPGCAGALGMSANAAPKVNLPNFSLTCTNAPRNSLGLAIITDVPDVNGSYSYLDLGILLHVDIFHATQLMLVDMTSDAGGSGFAPAPIPNNPTLAGQKFYVQTIWIESLANGLGCSHAPMGLVSSKGLEIAIGP
ncbi:MAG: VCBS repeat-containing protein [Planctomycetes bacterium]|nr:VCBS repeat-containing protein [Planctomycetota bacterium]